MTRILVAGATGDFGGFVVHEFKARGYFVRAMARSAEKLSDLQSAVDEVIKAEVTEPEAPEHVCDGIDVKAHEDLAEKPKRPGIDYAVLRLTLPVWIMKLAIAATRFLNRH